MKKLTKLLFSLTFILLLSGCDDIILNTLHKDPCACRDTVEVPEKIENR